MEAEDTFRGKFDVGVAKKYRWVMQQIRFVSRRNQLYQYTSLRLKKLERPGPDHGMHLTKKWILALEFRGADPDEIAVIKGIENHYGD